MAPMATPNGLENGKCLKNPFLHIILPWHRWILENGMFETASTILDLGCGNGTLARHIVTRSSAQTELIGVDASLEFLAQAEKQSRSRQEQRIQWIVGSWNHILYPDKSFDRVILEYLPDSPVEWKILLSELTRLVQQEGRVIILIPGRKTSVLSRSAHGLWRQVQKYRRFVGLPNRTVPQSIPTASEIFQELSPEFTWQSSRQWLGGYVEGVSLQRRSIRTLLSR
jgi:ubiquinone/menaquinone biosynthesis C-methylase UbiE